VICIDHLPFYPEAVRALLGCSRSSFIAIRIGAGYVGLLDSEKLVNDPREKENGRRIHTEKIVGREEVKDKA